MPEIHFSIQWPDGEITRCYSPSTIVREYFSRDLTLTIEELVETSTRALGAAGDRVEAKYGFACTSAAAELRNIQVRAGSFSAEEKVTIVDID